MELIRIILPALLFAGFILWVTIKLFQRPVKIYEFNHNGEKKYSMVKRNSGFENWFEMYKREIMRDAGIPRKDKEPNYSIISWSRAVKLGIVDLSQTFKYIMKRDESISCTLLTKTQEIKKDEMEFDGCKNYG
ncbi:hypothetical protein HOD29_02765 [archaeon]|jgi:hypothetical protein|nr:hypothetical protein [archaeon]